LRRLRDAEVTQHPGRRRLHHDPIIFQHKPHAIALLEAQADTDCSRDCDLPLCRHPRLELVHRFTPEIWYTVHQCAWLL